MKFDGYFAGKFQDIFREKKREKDREDLWKRLAAVELDPPKEKDPQILSKTPLTSFIVKRENPGIGIVPGGEKSPNSAKRLILFLQIFYAFFFLIFLEFRMKLYFSALTFSIALNLFPPLFFAEYALFSLQLRVFFKRTSIFCQFVLSAVQKRPSSK